MVGTTDIDELLTKGAWKTSRATDGSRTSSTSDKGSDHKPPVHRIIATVRRRDGRHKAPPPPSVEDEAVSLAKEYQGSAVGSSELDEEPKYIGDIEQNPVLLEVPTNIAERRFVLVSEPSESKPEPVKPEPVQVVDGSDAPTTRKPEPAEKVERPVIPPSQSSGESSSSSSSPSSSSSSSSSSGYEANTCRKYVLMPHQDKDKNKPVSPTRHELRSRRSRGDIHKTEASKAETRKIETDSDSDCRKFVLVRDGKEDERKPESPTRRELKQRRSQKNLTNADTKKVNPEPVPPPPDDCRKYVLVRNGVEEKQKPESPSRRELKERKSRMNLAKVRMKDSSPERINPAIRGHTRGWSGTQTQINQDYFPARDVPSQDGELLSPAVVRKHSTKGRREKEYYDMPRSPSASRRRSGSFVEPRSVPIERREPSHTRRETMSTGHVPKRSLPNAHKTGRRRDSFRYREEEVDRHPDRTATIPTYSSSRSNSMKRTLSARRQRESPPNEAIDSGSDVEYIPAPRSHRNSAARRSFVAKEGRDFVLVRADAPLDDRPKSRQTSPLTSPRVSSFPFPALDTSDPRASTFLPSSDSNSLQNGRDKSSVGISPRDSPPALSQPSTEKDRRQARSKSRVSLNNVANMSAPVITNVMDSPRSPPRSDLNNSFRQSAPIVPRWQRPIFEGRGKDPLTYKKFTTGVMNGTFEGLPSCPYMTPTTGYRGWLTLMKCDSFTICGSCFDYVFEETRFRDEFIPLPMRSDIPTSCAFGTSHWYQIAWFLTLKFKQPDLRILMSLADVLARNAPCPGMRPAPEVWYSIRDPYSTKMVPSFSVCQTCVSAISVLLPPLKNVFEPRDGRGIALDGFCSMRLAHNYQDNKFLEYWDALENVADVSMATRTPPNLQGLSDEVQTLSTIVYCPKDTQIRDGCWFFMRSLNELTVCKDCYAQVVIPWVREGNRIAKDFYTKSNYVGLATCQLYSERMRKVFDKACKNDDLRYLMEKVLERRGIERELRTEMVRLAGEAGKNAYAAQKLEELAHEWTEWE